MYLIFIFIFCFRCLVGDEIALDPLKGKLVVFAGISGSGKSSLSTEVAKRFNALCFLEPEEALWPEFVREKQEYGEFGSLMTIRSIRVHQLWKAYESRCRGNLVFVDTYYDKINSYYLGKPGMEWLMDPNDPYFQVASEVLHLDHQILPNADFIVLLDVSYEDWIEMLTNRGRAKDCIEGFQENYTRAKEYLFSAVQSLSLETGIPVIVFKQKYGTLEDQGLLLYELLKRELSL